MFQHVLVPNILWLILWRAEREKERCILQHYDMHTINIKSKRWQIESSKGWRQDESVGTNKCRISVHEATNSLPFISADIIQKWYLIDVSAQKKRLAVPAWGREEWVICKFSFAMIRCQKRGRWMIPSDIPMLTTGWVTKWVHCSIQVGSFGERGTWSLI